MDTPTPTTAAGSPAAEPADRELALWRRQDGQVVGGWRWIKGPAGESQLLLFLGPDPGPTPAIGAAASERPALGELVLQVRPLAMEGLGLLPPQLPQLVRRSEQLVLRTFPQGQGRSAAGGFSLLSGALQLSR